MRELWLVIIMLFLVLNIDLFSQENRTFNGMNNNLTTNTWGAANTPLNHYATISFGDGISSLNDANKPNPRIVSNQLFDQSSKIESALNLSDYVWVFGQFLDHDISLTGESHEEFEPIIVPEGDEFFQEGEPIIMFRSASIPGTGTSENNPRQFANEITSYIDGSGVYGSNKEHADWLRTFVDGKLKVSSGNLLPWNTIDSEYGSPQDPSAPKMDDASENPGKLFVAGDVRANENPLLIGVHTIFVREHNRLCDQLMVQHPNWTDEQIYQRARKMVGAFIQSITYNEWLPSMGVELPNYTGYNSSVNPNVMNAFSAAAFRIGHTLITGDIIRMGNTGEEIGQGNLSLRDAFFNPLELVFGGGIDPLFKGMATQVQNKMDCKIIGDLRNFLFGAPGSGGLDLASININRGRERGLPNFNQLREDFGLPRLTDFNMLTGGDEEVSEILQNLYGDINNLDPWVGILSEEHLGNSMFGSLTMKIIEKQFKNLRTGDRFYYENDPAFSNSQKDQIKRTTFHDIIMRNSEISIMQPNVFIAMPHSDIPTGPVLIQSDLEALIFPNPMSESTNLQLYSQGDAVISISIINFNGQLIEQQDFNVSAGENTIVLDFDASMPRGFYTLLIESGLNFKQLKFIKE